MKFLVLLAFFLISCSGSGSSISGQDTDQQFNNIDNNLVNFDCSAYSLNIEYCFITQNSLNREIYLYKPTNITSSLNAPVLFSFHGGGGTALGNYAYSGFHQIADSEKFYVVYPQGQFFQDKNSTGWIFNNNNNISDDLFFMNQVIDWVDTNYDINLDRIYSSGFSVGAIMSYDLACKLSNKIAAVAPVGGTMSTDTFNTCRPEKSKSVVHIHGLNDRILDPNGNQYIKSVNQSIEFWANFNQCTSFSSSNIQDNNLDGSSGTVNEHSNCNNQVSVSSVLLENYGHDWPSTRYQNKNDDIDSASYIWNFLKNYDLNGLIQ